MTEQLGAYAVDIANLSPEQTVHRLLEHAVQLQVSDLFFMTAENHVVVSARHLGTLHKLSAFDALIERRTDRRHAPIDRRGLQTVSQQRASVGVEPLVVHVRNGQVSHLALDHVNDSANDDGAAGAVPMVAVGILKRLRERERLRGGGRA